MVHVAHDTRVGRDLARPRKTPIGSVVLVNSPQHGLPFHGVVVDYRTSVRWGRYLIIETDWRGAQPRGAAVWRDSQEFAVTGRKSKTPGKIFRQNFAAELRGCGCQCCPHINGFEETDEGR
jgi:hypothetical protein